MLYQNSRPVARTRQSNAPLRRFEWRDFLDDSQGTSEQIEDRFKFDKDETSIDRFFLLPGRRNQITRLNDKDMFEIKTMVSADGPLELWETTVKSEVPMRRSLAQKIAARIPKFSGPVIGSMSAEELAESLSRKSRYFKVKTKRKILRLGDVTAKISRAQIGETHALSIAFESPRAEPLLAELKALGLRTRENINYGAFLLNNG